MFKTSAIKWNFIDLNNMPPFGKRLLLLGFGATYGDQEISIGCFNKYDSLGFEFMDSVRGVILGVGYWAELPTLDPVPASTAFEKCNPPVESKQDAG